MAKPGSNPVMKADVSLDLMRANDSLRQMLAEKEDALQALQQEAERWKSLTAIAADWYWEQDAEFRFKTFSPEAGSKGSYTGRPDLWLGRRRWEREGAVALSSSWDEHRAVLAAHQPFSGFEFVQLQSAEPPVYLSISGIPLFDGAGKFLGYRGIATDITSRKRLEADARESARFLIEVVENIPIATHLISVKEGFRIVGWNKQACTLFGVPREEALNCTMDELWPDNTDTVNCVHALNYDMVRAGSLSEFPDQPHPTRNRGVIRVHSRKVAISNAEGEVTHILCTTEDITERLAGQARLLYSEERHRAVVSALAEAVILRDDKGEIIDCNLSAERLLGKPLYQIRGSVRLAPEWDMLREDGSAMPVEEHPEVVAYRTGQAQSNALVCYRRADGSDLWALFNVEPLFEDTSQTPSGFVTSLTDITKRKQAELEIVRLNVDLESRVVRRTAQLEAANHELEAFSYSVAHDLRSPLGSIDGFCSLLNKAVSGQSDDRARHYMDRIRKGVRRMSELTNGLLALAQLSRTSLNWEDVDISAETEQVLKEHAEASGARNVALRVEPGMVSRGDRALLRQVLQNLIANAWKFTSKRGDAAIEIGCQINADEQTVYFIKDNGAGFDMAYADKLFGTFQRLHTEEEFSGSGIGLATVDRIIKRHGGRIWAQSAVDKGCTFFFTLGKEQRPMAGRQPSGPNEAGLETVRFTPVSVVLSAPSATSHRRISTDNDAFVMAIDQQFSHAFENAPIGMALVGLDSKRIRVNSAFCRMLGYSESEMMAHTLRDMTHPDDVQWDLLQRERAIVGEIETYQWEKRYIHQSGSIVWVYLTCSLVRDADRRPVHFLSQLLDITERKQSEQILRDSEERFRALITLSSDWFWEQDENLRFVRIEGDVTMKGGLKPEITVGKLRWELTWDYSNKAVWDEHKAQLARRETFRDFEITRVEPSGELRYVSISGVPLFDAAGQFKGYRGVGRDTTELRRMTEALRASELQLRQITDTVPAQIAYIDSERIFRFHNRACEEAFGLYGDSINGKSMLEVLGAGLYDSIDSNVEEVLSGYPVALQRTQETLRGDVREYVDHYFPRYGEGEDEGKVIGFYSLVTDVTDIANSDRLKSEAIATISTDLKPPLTAICDTLQMICLQQGDALVDGLMPLAVQAKVDCEKLICLIDSMLDVELIRAGAVRLPYKW